MEVYFSPATLLNALLDGAVAFCGVLAGATVALSHHRTTSRRERREDLAVQPLLQLYLSLAHLHAVLERMRHVITHDDLLEEMVRVEELCNEAIAQHRPATSCVDEATAATVQEAFGVVIHAWTAVSAVRAGQREHTDLQQFAATTLYAACKVRTAMRQFLELPALQMDQHTITAHERAMAGAAQARSGGERPH